ncbi:MAG: hypothetical protein ACOCVF_01265 [bacterium]
MENKAWNDLVKHIDKSKVFLEDLKQSNKNKQIAFLADATINDLNMIYSLAKKACEGQPVADTESGLHLADVSGSMPPSTIKIGEFIYDFDNDTETYKPNCGNDR